MSENQPGKEIMAKPKKKTVVRVLRLAGVIHVWADNLSVDNLMSIEGISDVVMAPTVPWIVFVDIRYDINEVAEELIELLDAGEK